MYNQKLCISCKHCKIPERPKAGEKISAICKMSKEPVSLAWTCEFFALWDADAYVKRKRYEKNG